MRFKKYVPTIGTLLLLIAGMGCDANRVTDLPSSEPAPADNRATVIRLTPDTATLAVGDIIGLSARVFDTDGYEITGGDIQWRLSAKAKVRLASDGTLEGIAEGEDTVYAALDGATSSSVFRIRPPRVASISITLNPAVVEIGDPARASAVLRKSDGTIVGGRIYWYSTNTAVATIDQDGNINTRRPGTTQIRAIAEGKLDSKTLSVLAGEEAPAVASVTVTSSSSTLYIGRTTRLTAVARDAAGNALTGAPIVWSSSSNLIATINSNGDATGMAAGSVAFTASSGGVQGQRTMSVAQVPVDAIALQLIPAAVTVGGSSQAQATTYDSDGEVLSGRSVAFASSNTAVATVTQAGVVSTHSVGNANISASSEGKSTTAALVVNSAAPVPVATVSVSLVDNSLEVGQTTQALATPRDAGGAALSGRAVTWTSSNPAVATVSSTGLVTAVTAGNANIVGTSEGQNGSAALGVAAPPPAPTVTYFGITPASASLLFGGTQQFQRSVSWSDGATRAILVTYSASGGTITAAGLYTAGQAAGSFRVIATCDCGLADTVAITVSAPPQQTPLLTGVEVTPSTATVSVGQTQAFSVTGRYSNGSTGPVSITWSATGGGITSTGIYTAGQTAGSFLVIAMCACGFSDTSAVAVIGPQPTMIAAMTVAPENVSLAAGQSYQFVANGWTSGASTPISTPATWSATGGTVDQTGRYTAGSVAGVYVVRGQSTLISWGRDSSFVTITSGSPPSSAPVATISVALASSSRSVGQTTTATATLRDASNNVLTGRTIAWSSTNTSVATVNSSGTVTAVAAGSASIRATSEGVTGQTTFTVTTTQVAPVATVSVTITNPAIGTGSTAQATATLRDALNNLLTGRVVVWSSSSPLVAAVTPTGLVTGLATGSATITATSEGRSGSVVVSVSILPPPPPPPVGATNEPAGLNVIVNYGCEARPQGAFQPTQPGYISTRVQFFTESGNNMCRFANPAGADDYGTGSIVVSDGLAQTEIYSRFMVRPAANFLAHSIGTKYLYIFAGGGGNHSIPVLGGSSLSEPIRVKMAGSGGFVSLQQSSSANTNWIPNRDRNVDIVRGQWNSMEFYGRLNTVGQSNGIYRIWVNGRLVMEMTDVVYRTNTSGWGEHDLLIYHGGMGFPIPTASHLDVDYFYVSGR